MDPKLYDALVRVAPMGLALSQPPPGVRDKSQVAMLRSGEEYMLDGSIRKVKMGLGWDAGCDVDASCAMFDANKRLVDAVSFKKLVSSCKAVKHSGDDRTGDGGGDDEVIKVALEKVPLHIHYLVFIVCIFNGGFDFRNVKSCSVRMVHRKKSGKNPELARLNLSGGPGEAMCLCALVRKGSWWSMVTFGLPVMGRTIEDVMQKNQQLAHLTAPLQAFFPQLKLVTVVVLGAKGLVGKDSHMFSKATSDPYYKLKYSGAGGKKKKVFVKSETKEETLDPTWTPVPIPLGYIFESDMKCVTIHVFDEDTVTGDDFLGEVRIPAGTLWNSADGTREEWFVLHPMYAKPGKAADHPTQNVKGHLRLKFQVASVPVI